MKIIKGRKLRRWLTLVNIRGQVVLHREEHIQHHAVLPFPHRAELPIEIPSLHPMPDAIPTTVPMRTSIQTRNLLGPTTQRKY